MDISRIKKYEPIDGKWYITKELGSGSYGTVYEVERRDFGVMKAAMKVVSIPSSQNEYNTYREENYDLDEQSISSYYYGFVEEFVKEFQLMEKLKGHSNIVGYEDHNVVKRENEFGWDIFIRMELLTPMNKHFSENAPTKTDIIKLGIDICKALEVCHNQKIIHRDIKPSNIFVSNTGEYKLGDFGVARTFEKTSSEFSKKGTYVYMAPEIYRGEKYSSNVDIYSLGIVLYKLLNNNMEPFRTDRGFNSANDALEKRMSNAPMPAPENADGELADIVLKACSYNPSERYENPTQMRKELEKIVLDKTGDVIYSSDAGVLFESSVNNGVKEVKSDDEEKTTGLFNVSENDKEQTETLKLVDDKKKKDVSVEAPAKKRKNKTMVWGIVAAIVLIIIGICAFMSNGTQAREVVSDIAADVNIKDENGETVLVDSFETISKCHNKELGYYLELELSNESQKAIASYTSNNIGKTMAFCVNDEVISAPQINEKIDSNKIIISGSYSEQDIDAIIEKLRTPNSDIINGEELESNFIQVNDYLESVKNDKTINQDNIAQEITALTNLLKGYQIDTISEQEQGVLAQIKTDWNEKIIPARDSLVSAYDKELTSVEEKTSNDLTTKQKEKTETTVKTESVKKQDVTTTHTETPKVETCSICGSKDHKASAHCAICESLEHTNHPTCATCGSTTHTVHKRCPACGEFHTRKEHPCCEECGSPFHTVHTFYDYEAWLQHDGIFYHELDRNGNVIREVMFEW